MKNTTGRVKFVFHSVENLTEDEMMEEIILAESKLNEKSRLRFYVEEFSAESSKAKFRCLNENIDPKLKRRKDND